MEIKFEITEEDYINFNLHHIENSPSQKKIFNLLRYIIPVISSIIIYVIGTRFLQQPEIYWMIIGIIYAVVWMTTYPKKHKKNIEKQTKKLLQEGDNSSIFGEKTMLIHGDRIEVLSELTSETISKKTIQDIKVYEDMILLYLSAVSAQIVPTRYLDEESREYIMKELSLV